MTADIAENVVRAKENIALAAKRAGRAAEDIYLVGATKMNDASRVREAICAGLPICGENRVQELLQKNAGHAYDGARLHFIGHLQKNKVRQIVGLVELIHSADSEALLREIDRVAAARGVVQDVLLEVNIAGESAKSGFAPEEIPAAIAFAGGLERIDGCAPNLRLRRRKPAIFCPHESAFY